MNKYLILNEEIISLENIVNSTIDKKERTIKIMYMINNYPITLTIDYSDIKDDINEEKTIVEKDYEKLQKNLFIINVEELEELVNNITKNYDILKELKAKYLEKIITIKEIIEKKGLSSKKIKEIKKIIGE